MKLILASDHRGFQLKEFIKSRYHDAIDVGPASYDPKDDYVDYAKSAVAQLGSEDKAVLVCGSGHGMDIAANRFPHVRAILGFNLQVVEQGRQHEDANVLIIPADWTNEVQAKQFIDTFLNTPFSNEERHQRRLEKLGSL